jgi:4'-phosphopantetheinyl transferase
MNSIYSYRSGHGTLSEVREFPETTEALRGRLLTGSDLTAFGSIQLDKRRREWLATRLLLQEYLPGSALLTLPNGKPVLENGPWISFSHSGIQAGILLSPTPCGIDIQPADPRLEQLNRRFTHPAEQEAAPENQHERLNYFTTVWSAKEAVFKCYGERVNFADHIRILPFIPGEQRICAQYDGEHGSRMFDLVVQWNADTCIVHTA